MERSRDELLDARLEVSAGHVDRALDVALLELVLLADIDQGDVAPIHLLGSLGRLNLFDSDPRLCDQIGAAGAGLGLGAAHYFRKYSEVEYEAEGLEPTPGRGAFDGACGPAPRSEDGC